MKANQMSKDEFLKFADIGRRIMRLNARQVVKVRGKERIILPAIEDITERRETENMMEQAQAIFYANTRSICKKPWQRKPAAYSGVPLEPRRA